MTETKLRIIKGYSNGLYSITFNLEWSYADLALIKKFGSPEINVGGTFLRAADLELELTDGVVTGVDIDFAGDPGAYIGETLTLQVVDPTAAGEDAALTVTLTDNFRIDEVTVSVAGSGYGAGSYIETNFSNQVVEPTKMVKLTSFPYVFNAKRYKPSTPALPYFSEQYIATLTARIEEKLEALRALPDITSEEVHNI